MRTSSCYMSENVNMGSLRFQVNALTIKAPHHLCPTHTLSTKKSIFGLDEQIKQLNRWNIQTILRLDLEGRNLMRTSTCYQSENCEVVWDLNPIPLTFNVSTLTIRPPHHFWLTSVITVQQILILFTY